MFITLQSCESTKKENKTEEESHEGHDHSVKKEESAEEETHEEQEGVELSQAQIKTIGLEFGDFSKLKINDSVSATGVLSLPPKSVVSVSAKAAGFISFTKNYIEGSYIEKGELIGYLSSSEYIKIQKEYLKAKASLSFSEKELDRHKSLLESGAVVLKDFQKMKAENYIDRIEVESLANQLSFLGIKTSTLTIDNMTSKIPVRSPISGSVASVSAHRGVFVEPNKEIMEVIDEDHLHLELDVFEKDIALIKNGQNISYNVPSLGDKRYNAKVFKISKQFDKNKRTLNIHGHLEDIRPRFINDIFVNAKIWLNNKTVMALPEEAIVEQGLISYIYVSSGVPDADGGLVFDKIMVKTGSVEEGFIAVELIDTIEKGYKIVVKSAYYLLAQSKSGSLKHEH